jgi:ParB family chromosome partitioning protein
MEREEKWMATRRNALGRGLGALIPAPSAAAGARPADSDPVPQPSGPYTQIKVDRIRPNPDQPRRDFDADELAGLADSIVRHGLLQPVVVRQGAEGYELVVGERRWRAARLAGLETIPAMVKDVASRQRLEMALVENVQRQDLNPIELALAFRALTEGGATQEGVGERVGLDRSTIANHLRLLDLPRELQQEVESGVLSAGHAKALLQIDNPERRRHLRDRIVANQLSVRAAEELARALSGTRTPTRRRSRAAGDTVDPNLRELVDRLRDQLQTKVRITSAAGRGKIEIEFYGPEDLHRISRAILEGAP